MQKADKIVYYRDDSQMRFIFIIYIDIEFERTSYSHCLSHFIFLNLSWFHFMCIRFIRLHVHTYPIDRAEISSIRFDTFNSFKVRLGYCRLIRTFHMLML